VVFSTKAHVNADWTLDAARRSEGFDEGYQQSFGPASVALNSGALLLAQQLDFDLSPGTASGRDPLLVFNSGTLEVRPVIQADLKGAAGVETPSELEVQLVWNGQPQGWRTVSTEDHEGNDYVFAAQVSQAVKESGVYNWKLQVRVSMDE